MFKLSKLSSFAHRCSILCSVSCHHRHQVLFLASEGYATCRRDSFGPLHVQFLVDVPGAGFCFYLCPECEEWVESNWRLPLIDLYTALPYLQRSEEQHTTSNEYYHRFRHWFSDFDVRNHRCLWIPYFWN